MRRAKELLSTTETSIFQPQKPHQYDGYLNSASSERTRWSNGYNAWSADGNAAGSSPGVGTENFSLFFAQFSEILHIDNHPIRLIVQVIFSYIFGKQKDQIKTPIFGLKEPIFPSFFGKLTIAYDLCFDCSYPDIFGKVKYKVRNQKTADLGP